MAKHRMTVEEHYSVGRVHPRGRVIDDGAENRIERHPSMESKGPALRNNRNQDPEDKHDDRSSPRGYDNDVSKRSWLQNGDATTRPNFDFGNSWRRADKGNNNDSPGDPAVIRRPVGEKK